MARLEAQDPTRHLTTLIGLDINLYQVTCIPPLSLPAVTGGAGELHASGLRKSFVSHKDATSPRSPGAMGRGES